MNDLRFSEHRSEWVICMSGKAKGVEEEKVGLGLSLGLGWGLKWWIWRVWVVFGLRAVWLIFWLCLDLLVCDVFGFCSFFVIE